MASNLRFNVTANDAASGTFAAVAAQAQALNAELDRLDRRIRIKVALDAPSAAQIRATTAAIADLDGKTVRAKVRIDSPSASDLAGLAAVRSALDAIDGRNARARVSITGTPGAAEVGQLRAAAAALSALDGRNATARVRINAPSSADLARIAAAATALNDLNGRNAAATVSITSNIGAAEVRQLRAAAKAIRELDGMSATTSVQFTGNLPDPRELRAVARALQQLQSASPVTVVIHLIGNLQALAAIAAIAAALRQLPNNTNSRVNVDVDKADKVLQMAAGLGKMAAGLAAAAVAAPQATAAVASLAGALVSLAGLTPVAVAGVVAAGAAFAALKVGLSGVGDALKETDPKKFAEAMKGLAPAAQEFVKSVKQIGPAWKGVQLDTQQKLFAGLGGEMQKLSTAYLPSVKSGLGQIAGGFNGMAKDLVGFATSAKTVKDVDTIFRNTAVAVQAARPGVVNLAAAFRDIATVGSEMLPELAGGFTKVTGDFSNFIAKARESGQLKVWIQEGVDTLQTLGSIAGNVGTSLGAVFKASQASGVDFLGTVDEVTQKVSTLLNSTQGQAALTSMFTEAGAAIDDLMPGLEAVAAGVLELVQAFANTGAVQTLATALSNVGTAIAPLGATIGNIAGTALNALASGANVAVSAMTPLVGTVGGVLDSMGSLPGTILAAVVAFKAAGLATGVFAAGAARAAAAAAYLRASTMPIPGLANGLAGAMTRVGSAVAFAGRALPAVAVGLILLGPLMDEIQRPAKELGEALMQGGDAAGVAAVKNDIWLKTIDRFAAGAPAVSGILKMFAQDTASVTAEYEAQVAAMTPLEQAQLRVAQATRALGDAQKSGDQGRVAAATLDLRVATEALATAHESAADAAKTQAQRESELADKMRGQIGAALQYAQAVRQTAEAQKEANAAIKAHGINSEQAQTAILNLAGAMAQQAESAKTQATALGGSKAGLLAFNTELLKTATASPASRAAFIQLASSLDKAGTDALSSAAKLSGLRTEIITLPDGRQVTVVVAADLGKLPDVKAQLAAVASTPWIGVIQIISESENARGDIMRTVQFANGQRGTIQTFANGQPAIATINGVKYQIDATTGTLKVLSDVGPGEANFNGFKLMVDGTTGQMKLVMDTATAAGQMNAISQPRIVPITGLPIVDAVVGAFSVVAAPKDVPFNAVPNVGAAESALTTVARARLPLITAVPIVGAAQAALDALARPRTITYTVVIRTVGSVPGFGALGVAGAAARLAGGATGAIVHPMRDGGVLGMKGGGVGRKGLTPMRGGIAQVVKPNTWRVIGDRISGDEFFLPDDDKARSMRIGEEWARRRGLQLIPAGGTSQLRGPGSAGVSAIRPTPTITAGPTTRGSVSASSTLDIRPLMSQLQQLTDELRDFSDIAHDDANLNTRVTRAMADAMVAAAMARSDAVASGARTRSRLGMHANG